MNCSESEVESVGARGLDVVVGDELTNLCLGAIEANVMIIDEAIYAALKHEGLARSRRDPNGWPAVAGGLALSAAIWNNDNDLLGTCVPTWAADTLQGWLDRNPN